MKKSQEYTKRQPTKTNSKKGQKYDVTLVFMLSIIVIIGIIGVITYILVAAIRSRRGGGCGIGKRCKIFLW